MKKSPWFPYRRKASDLMYSLDCQPGDILVRLGAATVYGGLVNLSNIMAAATNSKYSHVAMIVEEIEAGGVSEYVIADVSGEGLRRQFFMDWVVDVYSDDFLILRHEDAHMIRKAVKAVSQAIYDDAEFDELFVRGWESLYCVELVCLAYEDSSMTFRERAVVSPGVTRQLASTICEAKPMNQLLGWKGWMGIVAKLHGISPSTLVWYVGNKDEGILSCKELMLYRTVTLTELKGELA